MDNAIVIFCCLGAIYFGLESSRITVHVERPLPGLILTFLYLTTVAVLVGAAVYVWQVSR